MIVLFFEKVKPHCCETAQLADAVTLDIKQRYGETCGHKISVDSQVIDYGGCLVIGTKPVEIPGTQFSFFAQHYSLLRDSMSHAISQGDRGLYFKVYAQRCHCITKETFEKTKEWLIVNEQTLLAEAATQSEDLLERISRLK
ncbi:hypothetical protein [Pantanalinema sp. GBBB05]|uniref:hypothetical protein n=1 Tax=Pantanalinema sp. GBBB05 TaxID=2604139 RepID=UPI003D818F3A